MIHCWNCGTELHLSEKISFRATCDKCHFYLHCCKNCRHYKVGQPNDCLIPGTEPISDRTASNYCEDFSLLGKAPDKRHEPKEAEKRLFGESSSEEPKSPKSKFDSLFKD